MDHVRAERGRAHVPPGLELVTLLSERETRNFLIRPERVRAQHGSDQG